MLALLHGRMGGYNGGKDETTTKEPEMETQNIDNLPQIVYLYTFPNGKRYVGKTAHINRRVLNSKQYAEQPFIYNALNKAERNGDTVELEYLSGYETPDVASSIEKQHIALYKTNVCRYGNGFGYNLTDGGEGVSGYKWTEEERADKAAATTNLWQDPEFKAKRAATFASPEFKARHKANTAAAMARTEVKARHKAGQNIPEVKAKKSESGKATKNKHENKEHTRLATQLQWHEKRLEKEGLL